MVQRMFLPATRFQEGPAGLLPICRCHEERAGRCLMGGKDGLLFYCSIFVYLFLIRLNGGPMCGRYALVNGKRVYLKYENMNRPHVEEVLAGFAPRFNVAPMQRMPVIAVLDKTLKVELMQWTLVPHWSKTSKTQFSTINAVGEKLDESKLYAPYFRSSRCLIPADAFYEWKKNIVDKEVRGKRTRVQEKQPVCVRMKDESPFMFAGLFSIWTSEKGEKLPTFTIITTTPNTLMEGIHNRMPVILQEKDFERWLDREYRTTSELKELLKTHPPEEMVAYPVSRAVNSPSNDTSLCLEPLEES